MDKDKKVEFLRQYIATELLYNTAKREGLDKDKEVMERSFQAKKTFMVNKLLEERVAQKISPSETDVRLYYEANKDKFAEKDADGNVIREKPLSEVQQQVAQAYYQERYQEESMRLMGKMMEAESVQIFTDRIQ